MVFIIIILVYYYIYMFLERGIIVVVSSWVIGCRLKKRGSGVWIIC